MEEMLPTENPMGTAKISGLVLKTGLPLIISLLINSLYNFVDSVFVARISEDALTALSLAAPIQIIMSAMGLGIAVGLNAVISRALGERNRKRVEETASAALVLAIYVNSVLMAITPTIFTPSILLSMKALSAVVKSLCQCFSVPQTAGIRHVSVFPAVLPCFDGGRHNAGPSLSISVYQARHAPSQHCGPSRAVRQAVFCGGTR